MIFGQYCASSICVAAVFSSGYISQEYEQDRLFVLHLWLHSWTLLSFFVCHSWHQMEYLWGTYWRSFQTTRCVFWLATLCSWYLLLSTVPLCIMFSAFCWAMCVGLYCRSHQRIHSAFSSRFLPLVSLTGFLPVGFMEARAFSWTLLPCYQKVTTRCILSLTWIGIHSDLEFRASLQFLEFPDGSHGYTCYRATSLVF